MYVTNHFTPKPNSISSAIARYFYWTLIFFSNDKQLLLFCARADRKWEILPFISLLFHWQSFIKIKCNDIVRHDECQEISWIAYVSWYYNLKYADEYNVITNKKILNYFCAEFISEIFIIVLLHHDQFIKVTINKHQ